MRIALLFTILLISQFAHSQRQFPEPSKDETGFVKIFDGTLNKWEGDPVYWSVDNGELVGKITPETIVKQNTFIIWRGGTPSDFELKVDVKVSDKGNSGINYRSVEFEKYRLRGYQCDIDGPNQWSGQNYEEQGRKFLALRGQVSRKEDGKEVEVIGTVGEREELTQFIKQNDWNEYHVIAKGDILVHMINGHVMSVVIDNDEENKTRSGLIGVQVHVGPPMEIRYRNFRLKELTSED
ncbi:MAG: DUF1080 domain-containing protein [Bacteroidota bacterium]